MVSIRPDEMVHHRLPLSRIGEPPTRIPLQRNREGRIYDEAQASQGHAGFFGVASPCRQSASRNMGNMWDPISPDTRVSLTG